MFYPTHETPWRSAAQNLQHIPTNEIRWKPTNQSAGFDGGLGYSLGWNSFAPREQRLGPQSAFRPDAPFADGGKLIEGAVAIDP